MNCYTKDFPICPRCQGQWRGCRFYITDLICKVCESFLWTDSENRIIKFNTFSIIKKNDFLMWDFILNICKYGEDGDGESSSTILPFLPFNITGEKFKNLLTFL